MDAGGGITDAGPRQTVGDNEYPIGVPMYGAPACGMTALPIEERGSGTPIVLGGALALMLARRTSTKRKR